MQDFRSFSELGGRIFGGAAIDWAAGGDSRSLKSFPSAIAPPPQLKCPRCESLNTKFCYYNNYNLSQPRHFCKSCRRYWTRGGVLRNVPVGGGCRKPKRSSSSKSSSEDDKDRRHKHSGSRSSSDSSTLTLTLTPDCPAPLPDSAIPFKSSPPNPNPPNSSNPTFLDPPIYPPAEIFPDLTPDQSILKFNFLDPLIYRHPDRRHRNPDEIRGQEFIYQNAPGEPPPATAPPPPAATARDAGGEIDWPSGLDSGIYDLAGAGDPAAYWNPSHWSDGDPSLYLP